METIGAEILMLSVCVGNSVTGTAVTTTTGPFPMVAEFGRRCRCLAGKATLEFDRTTVATGIGAIGLELGPSGGVACRVGIQMHMSAWLQNVVFFQLLLAEKVDEMLAKR